MQEVSERQLVSRSMRGSKRDGIGKIPPDADVKLAGPFEHAATYATMTKHSAEKRWEEGKTPPHFRP